jgi:hypothetical protein
MILVWFGVTWRRGGKSVLPHRLVASDRGRQDESAANTEEDSGWNDAWRVEITKNKNYYLNLVQFGRQN